MKQVLIDSLLNHPATSPAAVGTIAVGTPTTSTAEMVIKVVGMVIALIPAIKQLFAKKSTKKKATK